MAEYTILITKTAQEQLDKLSDHIAQPIFDVIRQLAHEPGLPDAKS